MEVASFEWGWDALVAIGTIALALGTVYLAWGTRSAARATSEDVRAQWRPVLVPAEDLRVDYADDLQLVVLAVRNVGKGAAYDIEAGLDTGRDVTPAHITTPGMTDRQNLALLPADHRVTLRFNPVDSRPSTCALIIDYVDLNGRPYSSRIAIDEVDPYGFTDTMVLRMRHVELRDNREQIPWKEPKPTLRARAVQAARWRPSGAG